MAGDPEKNWGIVALMVILIIAVFVMIFFSFKWARPGDRYSPVGTPGGVTEVEVTAPPVIPPAPLE